MPLDDFIKLPISRFHPEDKGVSEIQTPGGKVYVQRKRVNTYLNNVSAHVRKVERKNKMENLQMFDFEGNQVRTLKIDDEPYFVGKDVANILGYAEPRRAVIQHVDKEDRKSLGRKDWGDLCPNLWANPYDFTNKAVVNESGVYALIFGSKMPSAKKFTLLS